MTVDETAGPGPSRWAAVGAWLLFAWLLVACGTAGQPSPDLWWQLAGGRIMVEQHQFPWTDAFSFTAGDRTWLNHEWLAECGMYGLYRVGGLAALHVVRLLLLFLVFWTVSRVAVMLGAGEIAAAAAASLAVLNAQGRFFFDVRPYLFTYLGVALSYCCAIGWLRSGRARWLWLLLPIYAVWANLHSGVIAGLALLMAAAVGAARQQRAAALRLVAATVGAAAASTVNPYGAHILTFPFEFLSKKTIWSRGLNEWAPPHLLGEHGAFLVFMIFVTLCAAYAWRALGLSNLLVLAGFGVLAVSAWRHLTVFAIVAVPTLAVAFAEAARAVPWSAPRGRWLPAVTVAVGLVGLGVQLSMTRLAALSMEPTMFPVDAVRFLEANPLPPRLYNAYGWGGYLLWRVGDRYQVFMDGRANTLYPEEAYEDFLRIGAAVPDWDARLQRRDVHVVVLNQWEVRRMGEVSLARALAASPRWGRLYRDDLAEIWVARDATTRELWARAEAGRLWFPPAARLASGWDALESGHLDDAARTAQGLIDAHEEEARASSLLAVVRVRQGRMAEAEACLRRAIELDPTLPEVHYNLGALLAGRGQRAEAIEALEQEVRVNPDFKPARQRLEQLRGAP